MTQHKTYTVYYDVVTTYKVRFTENEMYSYGIEFHDAAHLTKLLQRSKTENPGNNTTQYEAFEDMVHDTLLPFCSYLDWEAEPSIVTVANVQHLGTYMRIYSVNADVQRRQTFIQYSL